MGEPARLYEENLDVYDRAHYSHGEAAAEVGELLSWYRKPHARIIDLGCGSGIHALILAEKGHSVVGLDNSRSAIRLARARSDGGRKAGFELFDLETDELSRFGIADLVTALGNTISHIDRLRLLGLFDKVRRVLAPGGAFVFNALYWASPFAPSVVEHGPDGEVNIVWERRLKEDTGRVRLKGRFVAESCTHEIEVNCYKVPEMVNLMKLAGFTNVRWSSRLDFTKRALKGANTVYYRAVMPKRGR